MISGKLTIKISKTRAGGGDYVQIISSDMTSVNIALVVGQVDIIDHRKKKASK